MSAIDIALKQDFRNVGKMGCAIDFEASVAPDLKIVSLPTAFLSSQRALHLQAHPGF